MRARTFLPTLVLLALAVPQLFAPPLPATTTLLTSSVNPSLPGQTVHFVATVLAASIPTSSSSAASLAVRSLNGCGPDPTGTVSFYDGAALIVSGAPVGGAGPNMAGISTSGLALGNHAITAVYSGDGCYGGSTSNVVNQLVSSSIPTLDPRVLGALVAALAAIAFVALRR